MIFSNFYSRLYIFFEFSFFLIFFSASYSGAIPPEIELAKVPKYVRVVAGEKVAIDVPYKGREARSFTAEIK